MGKSEAYDEWPRDRELPGGARQAEADGELAFEQLTEDLCRIPQMIHLLVVTDGVTSNELKRARQDCVGSDGFPPSKGKGMSVPVRA